MENNNILETRYISSIKAKQGIISGTAIVFDSESNLLGGRFKEIIKREAVTDEFLKQQDIVMKYNHGDDSILARYRKDGQRNSLNFLVDERGVHFNFKAKTKDAGLIESIEAGDIDACSFAFRIGNGGEKIEKRQDGTYLRTITKMECIKDFSLVINPAYSETSVSTRGIDELQQQEEAEKLIKAEEERQQQLILENYKKEEKSKLETYYKKYDDIIANLKNKK